MKYFQDIGTINFKWDQVANAFWQRYPNPFSKHVLSEDVISRHVDDKKLFTKRLLKKTNVKTGPVQRVVGSASFTFVVEESIVDPVKKIITTYTRNIGLTKFVYVDEKCVYKVNPNNSDSVVCEKQAWVESPRSGWYGKVICSFVHNRFKGNAKKAFNGFNHVLESLYGTTPHTLTMKEKLQDKAKKATDVAKKVKGYIPKS
ncbi:hypothetical protein FSP39_023130 [Pinctada imbricata]|uniref:PRELI/MSF1 domain-containing protein n=1 Tax=Pinctada imbricata TaxID=66713 RepID=A0AA88Y993_PINIB|nr:hypothetical protein FSP39_023130 [Pinctada imbricata]